MRHLTLIALALALAGSVDAAEATIPDVTTLNDLRAAPLLRLADGTECRVGLSTGGDAAGPWRVIYCLVEKRGEGDVRPPPSTQRSGEIHALGPLRYEVVWFDSMENVRLHVQEYVEKRPAMPLLYAGAVRLDRRGRVDLRVMTRSDELLAARTLSATEMRPKTWSRFASEQFQAGKSRGFVVEGEPLPAMPRFAGHVARAAATRPSSAESPLPGEIVDAAPKDPVMRVSLEREMFVVRSHPPFPDEAPADMLARWWVNGKLVAAPEPKRIGATQQMRQNGKARFVKEVTIPFGLPDFLGALKPGDRVTVQLLYAPGGHEPLIPMRMQQLLRMHQRDWPWPVLTNRLEFELTPALVAKDDNAVAPATGPSGP